MLGSNSSNVGVRLAHRSAMSRSVVIKLLLLLLLLKEASKPQLKLTHTHKTAASGAANALALAVCVCVLSNSRYFLKRYCRWELQQNDETD